MFETDKGYKCAVGMAKWARSHGYSQKELTSGVVCALAYELMMRVEEGNKKEYNGIIKDIKNILERVENVMRETLPCAEMDRYLAKGKLPSEGSVKWEP